MLRYLRLASVFVIILLLIYSATSCSDAGITNDNDNKDVNDDSNISDTTPPDINQNEDNGNQEESGKENNNADNSGEQENDSPDNTENNNNSGDDTTNSEQNVLYTVTFVVSDTESFTKTTSGKLQVFDNPVREHYEFLGWYNGESRWSFDTAITASITLTAKWRPIEYKISYVLNGAENNSLNLNSYSVSAPFPTLYDPYMKNGYFIAWYSNPEFTEPFVYNGQYCDITIFAKFIYETEGITYEKRDDVLYVKSYTGTDCNVLVPEFHDGLEVVGICEGAFSDLEISEILLPQSIRHIENNAFVNCNNLNYNEYQGFYYLGGRENPYHALIKCSDSEAEELNLNKETILIADSACKNMYFLVNISGAGKPLYIGNSAFENCSSLENISFVSEALEIGDYAFSACRAITSLNLNTVTKLGMGAFSYCVKLRELNITGPLELIPKNSFSYCEGIKNIVFGSNIKKLESGAFHQTNDSINVYYYGNSENWKAVDFTDNFMISASNIFFHTDTAPQDTKYKYWYSLNGQIKIW